MTRCKHLRPVIHSFIRSFIHPYLQFTYLPSAVYAISVLALYVPPSAHLGSNLGIHNKPIQFISPDTIPKAASAIDGTNQQISKVGACSTLQNPKRVSAAAQADGVGPQVGKKGPPLRRSPPLTTMPTIPGIMVGGRDGIGGGRARCLGRRRRIIGL